MPGAHRLWTGPFGAVLRDRMLRGAKIDASGLWIVPSRLARAQVLRELGMVQRAGLGLRVWCWDELWQAVLEEAERAPWILSDAAARGVLDEAIALERREGGLGEPDQVLGWPGFRRRLRARIAAWTQAERPVEGSPPNEQPVTGAEWAIHQRYRRLLAEMGAEDGAGLAVWASRQLLAKPPAGLRKFGPVAVLGLTSATRAVWRAIEAFHKRARTVDIAIPYLEDETLAEVFSCTKPLRERLLALGFREEPGKTQAELLAASAVRAVGLDALRSDAHRRPKRQACNGLHVLGTPPGEGMGLVVARQIKGLLAQGVTPEEILVLFPECDDTAAVVVETLEAWNLPVGAEMPAPLERVPAVTALQAAAALGLGGWESAAIVGLLRHGLVRPSWPEGRSGLALAAAAWAVRASRVFRGVEPLRAALARDAASDDARRAKRARTAIDVIEPLVRLIDALDRPRPWNQQSARLSALADALGLEANALVSLWDALEDRRDVLVALGQGERSWTWEEFCDELRALTADLPAVVPPALPGTVRVLSLAEADGACAEHVLLVNLAEGTAPSRSAVDPDLPALGPDEDVPPPANPALARESLRFLQTIGAARHGLHLIYPTSDEQGQPLLKAGFLEDLLDLFAPDARRGLDEQVTRIDPALREHPDLAGAPRDACVRAVALACEGDTAALARLARDAELAPVLAGTAAAIRIERERTKRGTYGPYDGRLADPAAIAAIGRAFGPRKVLSPSQLESFISCPFQFFLRYVLRLDALDERDELDEDYTYRGTVLHDILEDLEKRLLDEPADRLALSRALMHQRLEIESTVVSEIDGGLREIERFRLDQMLTRYARQHAKYDQSGETGPARPHKFEVVFGDERKRDSHPCLVLGEGDDAVRLQGKIDRIDLVSLDSGEGFRVIDYKTGACPTAGDVAGALYVQLPLYALAVERIVLLDRRPQLVDVGYWGLKKEGYRRIELKHWSQDQAAFEDYVVALAGLIRSGCFVVNSRREDCAKFCEYSAVCRIRQARAAGKQRDGFPTLEWLSNRSKREPSDDDAA